MEWMRCNSCWLKVEAKQSQFHLTQCGHVYCDKCIIKAEERCHQCGVAGTISLPLKEPLNPQISHYFTRPADLLEKVVQAEQFQESQLSLCLKRADINDNKYQSLKEAYWVSAENLKKVYQKYSKLKMTVAMIQKENNKSMTTTSHPMPRYETPANQINNYKCQDNHPRGHYLKKHMVNSTRNDEVFRVPTSTKVPRSAGYFTASSSSSNSSSYRMITPHSKYSNY